MRRSDFDGSLSQNQTTSWSVRNCIDENCPSRYKFERLCFCIPQFRGPFIITVQNRDVIGAEYEDSALGVVSQQIFKDLPTIDKLFDLIAVIASFCTFLILMLLF